MGSKTQKRHRATGVVLNYLPQSRCRAEKWNKIIFSLLRAAATLRFKILHAIHSLRFIVYFQPITIGILEENLFNTIFTNIYRVCFTGPVGIGDFQPDKFLQKFIKWWSRQAQVQRFIDTNRFLDYRNEVQLSSITQDKPSYSRDFGAIGYFR